MKYDHIFKWVIQILVWAIMIYTIYSLNIINQENNITTYEKNNNTYNEACQNLNNESYHNQTMNEF